MHVYIPVAYKIHTRISAGEGKVYDDLEIIIWLAGSKLSKVPSQQ